MIIGLKKCPNCKKLVNIFSSTAVKYYCDYCGERLDKRKELLNDKH